MNESLARRWNAVGTLQEPEANGMTLVHGGSAGS